MDPIFAFVDESGNHDLDVEKIGASDYFIVAAIVIKESAVEKIS